MNKIEQIYISQTESGYRLSACQYQFACIIGRSGLIAADKKSEGDGATPIGNWLLRSLFYRPDRTDADMIRQISLLPCRPITEHMGWVDDPFSPHYNQPIMLPCTARHEKLWRQDGLYDLILPLGYNDGPVTPHRGSAIFLHCAEADTPSTEGCVALQKSDLLMILPFCTSSTLVTVQKQAVS
ncbi:MAG: L,D-transpeptidase family protein [Pseudomonadota bacterium]|nr:L,D-transpeptidase family protein [Pseudomonadota bacterium]